MMSNWGPNFFGHRDFRIYESGAFGRDISHSSMDRVSTMMDYLNLGGNRLDMLNGHAVVAMVYCWLNYAVNYRQVVVH